MTAAALRSDGGREAGARRWAACLLLVLGLHVGAVLTALRRAEPTPSLPPEASEAIVLDLPPEPAVTASAMLTVAVAPAAVQRPADALPPPAPAVQPPAADPALAEVPPPEPAAPAAPSPPEVPIPAATRPPVPALLAPEPFPSPAPPLPLPPQPARPRPHTAPLRPPTPRSPSRDLALHAPARDVLPAPAAPSMPARAVPSPAASSAPPAPSSNAVPNWRGEVMARLLRAKRYPERARLRGAEGVAFATFTLDRAGRVLSASLLRGSGSDLLDEEAVAMIHRAAPFPPPPPDASGESLTLTVPVRFALR